MCERERETPCMYPANHACLFVCVHVRPKQDVSVVELEGSDSSEEEESSEEESSDEEIISTETLKLPGNQKRKANIEVLEKEGE